MNYSIWGISPYQNSRLYTVNGSIDARNHKECNAEFIFTISLWGESVQKTTSTGDYYGK